MGADPSGLDPIVVHPNGGLFGKPYYLDLPRGTSNVNAIADDIIKRSHVSKLDPNSVAKLIKDALKLRPNIGHMGKYDFHNRIPYDKFDRIHYTPYFNANSKSLLGGESLADAREIGRAHV